LAVCACYFWEVALNVGLDVSLSNAQNWKGILENEDEVGITDDGAFPLNCQRVLTLVLHTYV
jgi:hypothetical protein